MANMQDKVERARALRAQIEGNGLVASIPFVLMAYAGQIDDVTMTEHSDVFLPWTDAGSYKPGDIHRYPDTPGGKLYRCVQAHTAQAGWPPDKTPSLWALIGDPGEAWPDWSQPVGAHDAYAYGAKVSHNGKRWISDVANNVWKPGVAMWKETA